MTKENKYLLWGGVGLAGVLAFLWLRASGAAITSGSPSGPSLSLPGPSGGGATYTPASFNIPQNSNATTLPNPGSTALFNFNVGGDTYKTVNNIHKKKLGGCGSADGATGPCNCPGATTSSFGDVGDAGAVLAPFMQYLVDTLPTGGIAGASQALTGGSTNPFKVGAAMLRNQKAEEASGFVFGAQSLMTPWNPSALTGV